MSAEDTAGAPQPAAERSGKGGRWLLALLAIVVAGGGAAAFVGLPGLGGAGEEKPAQPLYFVLDPNLIVNFEGGGRIRYLQLGIELMTREPEAVEALTLHSPVLRNNLILLLSDQSYDKLLTREGKEALQQAALAEVQKVMTMRYGEPAVETLYFTSFVMQ